MDDQLTERIRALLADPQAAERIAAIAGALGVSPGDGAASTASPPSAPPQMSAPQPASADAFAPQMSPSPGGILPGPKDPRLDLLHALRPLVAEEKRGRLDDLVRIATVASLLGTIRK